MDLAGRCIIVHVVAKRATGMRQAPIIVRSHRQDQGWPFASDQDDNPSSLRRRPGPNRHAPPKSRPRDRAAIGCGRVAPAKAGVQFLFNPRTSSPS